MKSRSYTRALLLGILGATMVLHQGCRPSPKTAGGVVPDATYECHIVDSADQQPVPDAHVVVRDGKGKEIMDFWCREDGFFSVIAPHDARLQISRYNMERYEAPISGMSFRKVIRLKHIDKDLYNLVPDSIGQKDGVEKRPQFPGGPKAQREWLRRQAMRSRAGKTDGKGARIMVNITIEQDGTISDAEISHPREDLAMPEAEALRIVKKMPKWEPGLERGKPVRVKSFVFVEFPPVG